MLYDRVKKQAVATLQVVQNPLRRLKARRHNELDGLRRLILTPVLVPQFDLVKSVVYVFPIVVVFGAWRVGVDCVPCTTTVSPEIA